MVSRVAGRDGRWEAGWRVTMGHMAERLARGKGGKLEGRIEVEWRTDGRREAGLRVGKPMDTWPSIKRGWLKGTVATV